MNGFIQLAQRRAYSSQFLLGLIGCFDIRFHACLEFGRHVPELAEFVNAGLVNLG